MIDHYGNHYTVDPCDEHGPDCDDPICKKRMEQRAYIASNFNHLKEAHKGYQRLYGPNLEVLDHQRGCRCRYCRNYYAGVPNL